MRAKTMVPRAEAPLRYAARIEKKMNSSTTLTFNAIVS